MTCDRASLSAVADGDADAGHAESCPTCSPLLAAGRAARRAIRATATFPEPSQQAWFRLRYGLSARLRTRVIATIAGLAVAGAVAAGMVAAAVLAFLP